jgi:hypothetical protein
MKPLYAPEFFESSASTRATKKPADIVRLRHQKLKWDPSKHVGPGIECRHMFTIGAGLTMRKDVQLVLAVFCAADALITGPVSASRPVGGSRRAILESVGLIGISGVFATTLTTPAACGQGKSSPLVRGDESIMTSKAHGTTAVGVQERLRFGVDRSLADRICSYNRHFAEPAGSWKRSSLEAELRERSGSGERGSMPITFYDSVIGRPCFATPVGRNVDDFLAESRIHGEW